MRLVTFGCSHTYGEGILPEDVRVIEKIIPPSKASWAAHLAKRLDCELENQGKNAASVNYVVESLLRYRPQPDDIIAITFPNLNRFTLFNILDEKHLDKNCYIVPNTNTHKDMVKKLYGFFDDYNLLKMNTTFVDYAYRILDSYKLPYVCRFYKYPYIDSHDIVFPPGDEGKTLMNARDRLSLHNQFLKDIQKPTLLDHANLFDKSIRQGADGMHFSELIHEKFSLNFYDEFTNTV